MKRIASAFLGLALLALSLTTLPMYGQDGDKVKPVPAKKEVVRPAKVGTHGRGRVRRPDLRAVRTEKISKWAELIKHLPKVTAPSYDCRTLGQVPPIVDQGQCGSCWDFSGTCVTNCALIMAGYGPADGTFTLSEQYTLDCYSNGGCNGDDNTTVLDHAKSVGLPTTQQYGAYQGQAGKCNSSTSMKFYQISAWGFCTTTNEQGVAAVQDIKNAMVKFGPIGTGVAAGSDWDSAGANTTITGTSHDIDHDVVIVGWDDTHDNGDNSKGAWIMRNSWGTSWAQNGYCWVKYGADDIGTEAVWASATPLPVPTPPAPVPPAPTPTPTPTPPSPATVTITLSSAQVQSVITQAQVTSKPLPQYKEPPMAPIKP